MRPLQLILFLLFSVTCYCQIPAFTSNVTHKDTLYNEKLNDIVKDYDFSVAYTADSYWWAAKKDFYILALKNNTWTLITYKKHYQKDTAYLYDTTKPADISISKKRVSQNQVRKLFDVLDKESFWTMDTDSLSITTKKLSDSRSIAISYTDGVNYRFEIVAKTKMRIVEAYQPDSYLKDIPEVLIRQNFINCREAFVKLKKKYRS